MVFYTLESGECLAPLPCSAWTSRGGEASLLVPPSVPQAKASGTLTCPIS